MGAFVSFTIVQACNILLLILAVSMPGASSGIKYIFWPEFDRIDIRSMLDIAKMTHVLFQSAFGVPVFLGKHTQDHIFTLPHVLVAFFLSLVLSLINALKTAGFAGFFSHLCNLNVQDFFSSTNSIVPMATALSQAPGSNFWLLLHCIHDILKWSVCFSVFSEVLLSAIVEVFPTRFASRNNFPKSAILPAIFAAVGFPVSIALLYVRGDGWQLFGYVIYSLHELIDWIFFYFLALAIVPLCVSKVLNRGHEDFLTFAYRQGSQSRARQRKNLTVVCLVVAAVAAGFWLAAGFDSMNFSILFNFVLEGDTGSLKHVAIALLLLAFGIAILWAIVYAIMHCVNPSRFPCCRPLGKQSREEDSKEADADADAIPLSPSPHFDGM